MACVGSDGRPTDTGIKMLGALKAGMTAPEDIAQHSSRPLSRVRSGLRELTQAELVKQTGDKYELTEKGAKFLSDLS